eukprot:4603622-Amphidinium_carterae.1
MDRKGSHHGSIDSCANRAAAHRSVKEQIDKTVRALAKKKFSAGEVLGPGWDSKSRAQNSTE